jgi:hypothetical protein
MKSSHGSFDVVQKAWSSYFPDQMQNVEHPKTQFFCGSFLQVALGGMFVAFLVTSYSSTVNSAFLSLDEDAGTCSFVPITTTQGVNLDSSGHWETDRLFAEEETLYHIQFNEYDGDDDTWGKDMKNLNAVIDAELDFLRSIDDLAIKIMHLVSWRATIEATVKGSMTIWFNTNPTFLFDFNDNQLLTYIGIPADGCLSTSAWTFSGGKYTLTFPDVWDGSGKGSVSADNPGNFTHSCASFDLVELGFNW